MWNVATNIRHSAPENSLQMLVVNQRKQFTENASVALQQTILMHVLTKCPPVLEIRSYKYSTLLWYDCKDNKWVNYGRLWICCILPNNRASRIMVFFSANYSLSFGELCAKNPKWCANYANCAILHNIFKRKFSMFQYIKKKLANQV